MADRGTAIAPGSTLFPLREEDLTVETHKRGTGLQVYPSSRSSWVRITHVPSGIVAESDYYRSQLRNREEALAILRSRLEQVGWSE